MIWIGQVRIPLHKIFLNRTHPIELAFNWIFLIWIPDNHFDLPITPYFHSGIFEFRSGDTFLLTPMWNCEVLQKKETERRSWWTVTRAWGFSIVACSRGFYVAFLAHAPPQLALLSRLLSLPIWYRFGPLIRF